MLFSDNGWGFHGLYKSTDGGDNWALQSDTPNILGRDTDGGSTGGQSWYDMSLAFLMKMKIMLLLEVLIYGNRLMVGLLGTYLEVVVMALIIHICM